MKVAVLGASNKRERYSNKAVRRLLEHGHEVLPVNPGIQEIEGLSVFKGIESLPKDIDTLTVYVHPQLSSELEEKMILLAPRRIIFNPGTENPELQRKLEEKGILVQDACTLVLLSTGQF